MLAQSASAFSSVPATIAAWLGCLFFAVALYNALSTAVRGMKDRPAPADVRAEAVDRFQPKGDYATKEALAEHVAETKRQHENIFSKMGGMERGLRAEMDEKFNRITTKVDGIATNVSAVVREAELHTRQLTTLDEDIKQLLSR